MTYAVSITSQGQLSLPAQVRREFGLLTSSKVLISIQLRQITLQPISDFSALRGSIKPKKPVSMEQIHAEFADSLAKEGHQ